MVLATGDSDFGPVFRRLRELGKGVVGVGPSSVLSSSVELSCHDFVFTDDRSGKGGGRGAGGAGGGAKSKSSAGNGRGAAAHAGVGGGGNGASVKTLATRVAASPAATPPQLLSARGGFRFRQYQHTSGATTPPRSRDCGARCEERRATSPLLLDSPAPALWFDSPSSTVRFGSPASRRRSGSPSSTVRFESPPSRLRYESPVLPTRGGGEVVGAWATSVATPSVKPSWPAEPSTGGAGAGAGAAPPGAAPSDLSMALSRVSVADEGSTVADEGRATVEPVLAPGQLLLPSMVTSAAPASEAAAGATWCSAPGLSPPWQSRRDVNDGMDGGRAQGGTSFGERLSPLRGSVVREGVGGDGSVHASGGGGGLASLPPAFGGLGALSVVRPSEKLYRHLLSLDPKAEAGSGSLASDWGDGLSETTLTKGLISLAKACGGQDNEHLRAVEALGGFAGGVDGSAAEGGGEEQASGLGREEAFRVASLLQRCGFLSWAAKEQEWVVTVPADVEVLRRRRDENMVEELLTRCQEAGVPFEPVLVTNLLWAKKG